MCMWFLSPKYSSSPPPGISFTISRLIYPKRLFLILTLYVCFAFRKHIIKLMLARSFLLSLPYYNELLLLLLLLLLTAVWSRKRTFISSPLPLKKPRTFTTKPAAHNFFSPFETASLFDSSDFQHGSKERICEKGLLHNKNISVRELKFRESTLLNPFKFVYPRILRLQKCTTNVQSGWKQSQCFCWNIGIFQII